MQHLDLEFYDYNPKVTINPPTPLNRIIYKNKPTIINQFVLLCQDSDDSDNNNHQDYGFLDLDDIIWGVGLKSMIGVSWADECGA